MWLAVLKHSWCFTPHKLNGASSKILCRKTEKQGILHIHLSNSFSSVYQVHGQDGRRAGAYRSWCGRSRWTVDRPASRVMYQIRINKKYNTISQRLPLISPQERTAFAGRGAVLITWLRCGRSLQISWKVVAARARWQSPFRNRREEAHK